jgi:hypothetical protein
MFGVTDPCLQHAIKKLLVAGQRGAKATAGWSVEKDVREAIDSLSRFQEMRREEADAPKRFAVSISVADEVYGRDPAQGVRDIIGDAIDQTYHTGGFPKATP